MQQVSQSRMRVCLVVSDKSDMHPVTSLAV